MTFLQLKTDVEEWMARSDFPASVYRLATEEINNRLRVRQMLSDFTATTSGGSVSLPSDFMEFDGLYVTTSGTRIPLTATSEHVAAAGHRSSGTPLEYVVKAGTIDLNPIPDGAYDLSGQYYARLTDLSVDGDTNNVLDDYFNVYMAASLAFAFGWAQDSEQEAKWTSILSGLIDSANKTDRSARYSGPLKMRPQASA